MRHLRDVGFEFGFLQALWIDRYLELAQHLAEHGRDLGAPATKGFVMWITTQRRQRRRGQLELAREQALNRIGFSWDIREDRWQRHFAQFRRYKKGRPRRKVTRQLSGWMALMRQRWYHLPAHQRELLEKAGLDRFPQELQKQSLENQIAEVEAYAQKQACPACSQTGFLILHGVLAGYGCQGSERHKRGHRVFCSNRHLKWGCGRTFSVLFSRLLKARMIPASGAFEKDWLALSPALSDIDLRPAVYVSREHMPIITKADRLTSDGAKALEALTILKGAAPAPLIEKLKPLGKRELGMILDHVLTRAKQVQTWAPNPSLYALLALVAAEASLGENVGRFLIEIPPAQLRASLIPLLKDKPWAGSAVKHWFGQAGTISPVKNAIKTEFPGIQ